MNELDRALLVDAMSEHLSDKDLEQYRKLQMLPEQLLAADDHLSVCRECFARLDDDPRALAELVLPGFDVSGEEPCELDHISFERGSDYVDGLLNSSDREKVEAHIQLCSQCESEIVELRSIKVLVDANAHKIYVPSGSAIGTRAVSWWRPPAYRIPIQIGAALAAALLLFWTATLPLRSQVAELRAQLEQIRRENEELRTEASVAKELELKLADLERQNETLQRDHTGSTQIVLSLNDGDGRVALDRNGVIAGLEALPAEYRQAAVAALSRGRVEVPSEIRGLGGPAGKLMGNPGDLTPYGLISPVGIVVQSDRPTLKWQPVAGAASYVATVYAAHFKVAATSGTIATTEWIAPVSFERGAVYSWQVRAIVAGKEVVMPPPQAAEAKFKVLDGDKLGELEQIRRAHPKLHLVLGLLYAKMGLLSDSEREFQALVNANPKSSVAQNLLQSVSLKTKGSAISDQPR